MFLGAADIGCEGMLIFDMASRLATGVAIVAVSDLLIFLVSVPLL
jgi:hypothetical protein